MAGSLTISLSIDKRCVQLFYITGRFFILPFEMLEKLGVLWKEICFSAEKRAVFSYFAYVTVKKKKSNISGHKKTREPMASRFLCFI